MFGIYIHIPFCEKKCLYCDFVSFAGAQNKFDDYVNALVCEIEKTEIFETITSIFFGGGTPTLLSKSHFFKIFSALSKFKFSKNIEITIESNPGTVDKIKLEALKSFGANRLSFGLQAAQNSLLNLIGRIHTFEDFERNFEAARAAGFKNINVDLMFALPTQTVENWAQTLELSLKFAPEHISTYSLIIEEETPFHTMLIGGEISLPDENIDREMYNYAKKVLRTNSYEHYEISNFSKRDMSSSQNLCYWERGEYVGFGLCASSFLSGRRFSNTSDMSEYVEFYKNENWLLSPNKPIENLDTLSKNDEMAEEMFLGLRLTRGVSIAKFFEKFQVGMFDVFGEVIKKHEKQALLSVEGGFVRLSEKGLDLANTVMCDFLY